MSRKKAKKKQAKVMHVDKRGRRCGLNRIFCFFSFFFNLLSRLLERRRLLLGPRHQFTCLDVDPPTMPTYLSTV